jgi:hypothetical protein
MLRIAHGEMARETVIEALQRKRAARGDQALLQMLAMRFVARKRRQFGEDQAFLLRLINRHAAFQVDGRCAFRGILDDFAHVSLRTDERGM